MNKINFLDIFRLKQELLFKLDRELAIHGEEVAYIVYKLVRYLKYDEKYSKLLTIIASIHDIGAYQTDFKKEMKSFELINTEDHSAYGYSIVKNMYIDKDIASIVLYHHHEYSNRFNYINDIKIHNDAFLLSLADKVSIICSLSNYNEQKIKKSIKNLNHDQFKKEHIEALNSVIEEGLIECIINGEYKADLYDFLDGYRVNESKLKQYVTILPLTINFFSIQTAMHIVGVRSIAEKICDILNIEKSYREDISYGASFHDLGKLYTPIEILKKKGKLTKSEFEIMKKHVSDTEYILKKSNINKSIIRLAINHHEKLNGNGYPKGIKDNELSIGDRIITISDIFCALTEKRYYKEGLNEYTVLTILNEMCKKNEIDSNIIKVINENFDILIKHKDKECYEYEVLIGDLHKDFEQISLKLKNLY